MYTVDLTASDISLLDLLDDRERDRVSRCAGEADRARLLLGAALLRVAAGAQLAVPAASLTVNRTCSGCGGWHGRPTVPGTGLDVSVSHSGRVVAVAILTGGGRVGVDVESIRDRPVPEVVAWTIAEARFKAGGGPSLTIHQLSSPAANHVLTVATDQPNATTEVLDGTPLLNPAAAMFDAARQADWTEFLSDCGKFEAELAKEIRTKRFTLAELEEEEQSLERLRRWHRDLTARDVFGTPQAAEATDRLRQCAAACEDYAERVFGALHSAEETGR